MAGNPNIFETLFIPPSLWKVYDKNWERIYKSRRSFVSESLVSKYLGYAHSSKLKAVSSPTDYSKSMFHAIRLLYQLSYIYEGIFDPSITHGNDREILANVRSGVFSLEACNSFYEVALCRIKAYKNKLPKNPDEKLINDIIINIYKERVCA